MRRVPAVCCYCQARLWWRATGSGFGWLGPDGTKDCPIAAKRDLRPAYHEPTKPTDSYRLTGDRFERLAARSTNGSVAR